MRRFWIIVFISAIDRRGLLTPDPGQRSSSKRIGLAYVGITRAQTELCFVLCKERRQFGDTVNPEPSRFLLELPQDDLQWEARKEPASAEQRQQKANTGIANLRAMLKEKG